MQGEGRNSISDDSGLSPQRLSGATLGLLAVGGSIALDDCRIFWGYFGLLEMSWLHTLRLGIPA